MIQPHEAAGLTAALANSVDRCAADLTALMRDAAYSAQLDAATLTSRAHVAALHLASAASSLRAIAATLPRTPPPPGCDNALCQLAGVHLLNCPAAAAQIAEPAARKVGP